MEIRTERLQRQDENMAQRKMLETGNREQKIYAATLLHARTPSKQHFGAKTQRV